MSARVRPARESELGLLGELVAAQQDDGRAHIAYLGMEPGSIAEELAGLEPLGVSGVLVAVDGERLIGALGADWDRDPPRAWWHGPFVFEGDWDTTADRLLAEGQDLLPAWVTEQEFAADDRNDRVAAFARRHGFVADEASAALWRPLDDVSAAAGTAVAAFDDLPAERRAAVAELHDQLFPKTYVPGHRLAEGKDRLVLVAGEPEVLGYVAVERQSDGVGYIHFLGVAEAARGAGLGTALVAAACRALEERYGCSAVHLSVRESDAAARRLYERCGFVEERLLRPWRRGFGSAVPAARVDRA